MYKKERGKASLFFVCKNVLFPCGMGRLFNIRYLIALVGNGFFQNIV